MINVVKGHSSTTFVDGVIVVRGVDEADGRYVFGKIKSAWYAVMTAEELAASLEKYGTKDIENYLRLDQVPELFR